MSKDLPKAGDYNDASDVQLKSRGRNRICKQCKFTCTNSKEFFQHQMYAHAQETDASKSNINRKNSSKTASNITVTKRQFSRSDSITEISLLHIANMEKINGCTEQNNSIDDDDEKYEDSRLIIAEEEHDTDLPTNLTPLRSGNIQNRTYMCNHCEFNTTSAKTFLHHQKDKHNLEFIIYECDICEYATKYKQKLPRHRKLHFTGKDSILGSDLDNSFSETKDNEEQIESTMNKQDDLNVFNDEIEQNFHENEPEIEEPDEEEEQDSSLTKTDQGSEIDGIVAKKKKTRQEVDPAKYFEVFDDMGIKFACSKCGNVYKWRKSLNKHWKEKHFGDIPNHNDPPPGLTNYQLPTTVRNRSVFGKSFVNGSHSTPASASPSTGSYVASHSCSNTPQSNYGLQISIPLLKVPADDVVVPMPKIIGPFITHSSQPVFPVTSTPVGRTSEMQTNLFKRKMSNEALDFSKPSNPVSSPTFKQIQIKCEPQWNEESEDKSMFLQNQNVTPDIKHASPVLQCCKCAFVAKTLVDYSAHMTLHLNKRAFKCAECQEHFNGVDDLNNHFFELHADKISEHKEAIQKIPHGLQQTYHLLKMPLKCIASISSQELTSNEPKQLHCNLCSFVAKWPAELQKHAVSHSEERPFICMVCGSTYKWKWDLVKHFEKSHHTLQNPYKRREQHLGNKSSTSATPSASPAPSVDFSRKSESSVQKKRRLSDTDLSSLGDEASHLDNNAVYLAMFDEDGPDGKSSIAALESLARPLSEPMTNSEDITDEEQYSKYQRQEMESTIESVYCEDELDDLTFTSVYNGRPINEETQRAVLNAVRQRMAVASGQSSELMDASKTSSDILLPYKCPICQYRARWPSEITQHMKNHSDEKPFHCPRCNYKSKWKWDVVKHMKRCGGGTIKDVIDASKIRNILPPNVLVMPQGNLQKQTLQPVACLVDPFNSSTDSNVANQSSNLNDGSVDISKALSSFNLNSNSEHGARDNDSIVDLNQNSIKFANISNSIQQAKQQPLFHSIINQGQYHCMECPFVGTSPAELRRHSVMHSESKPFTCRVCGYSSRWKCDLKKHRRTYEHDLNHSSDSLSPVTEQDKLKLDNPIPADSTEQQSCVNEHTLNKTVYKCSKCSYFTNKKHFYNSHLRIHKDHMDDSRATAKFKCKQCDFHANDLSSFLQHKVMHCNTQNSVVSTSSADHEIGEVSTRTLHLKLRRKPVKQFKCAKCPYVCFKRSGIVLHEAMHEPRANEAYTCLYCDYNVYSKSLLLQHMQLHSEYNPTECVEFIKIDGNGEFICVEKSKGMEEAIDIDEEEFIQREELQSILGNYEQEAKDMIDRNAEIQRYMDGRMENCNSEEPRDYIDPTEAVLDLSCSSKATEKNNPPVAHSSVLFPSQTFPRPRSVLKLPCEWCDLQFPNVTTLFRHSKNVHAIELRDQEIAVAMRADLTKNQFGNPKTHFMASSSTNQANQSTQRIKPSQPINSVLFGLQELRTAPVVTARTSTPIISSHVNSKKSLNEFVKNAPQHITRPTPGVRSITKYAEIQPAPLKSASSVLIQQSQNPLKNQTAQIQTTAQTSLMQLVQKARKSTSPQKRSRSFQCTKCSFTAPNAVTYLRHIERHGSKCKHTCCYCDYSIDRLNLLYQHMKGTHGDVWKGTMEEKITMSTVMGIGDKFSHNTSSCNLDTSNEGSYDAIDDLIETVDDDEDYQEQDSCHKEDIEYSEMRRLLLISKNKKPVLVIQEEMTWCGISVQICSLDGKKHYKCPKCSYISSNTVNTTNHVRQHGGNMKYTCDQCDYSVDNLKLIYHHMETVHPQEPLYIEADKSAATEMDSMSDFTVVNNETKLFKENNASHQGYCCPRCPYKVTSRDALQRHLEMHEYDGCHQCKYCNYSVDRYNLLLHHQLVHKHQQNHHVKSPRKQIQPSRFKMDIMSSLNEASIESMKNIPAFKPMVKKIKFSSRKVRKHNKQHSVKSRYRCPHCNYSAPRDFLLRQHLKFHALSTQSEKNETGVGKINTKEMIIQERQSASNVENDVAVKTFSAESDIEKIVPNVPSDVQSEPSDVPSVPSDVPSVPSDVPSVPSDVPSVPTDVLSEPSDVPIEPLDVPSEPLDVQSVPSDVPSVPSDVPSVPTDVPSEPSDVPSEPLDVPSEPLDVPSVPSDVPSVPSNIPSVPSNIPSVPSDVPSEKAEQQIEQINTELSKFHAYQCKWCPFGSNSSSEFHRHCSLHGASHRYQCNYCSYSLDCLHSLVQHQKLHNQQPDYNANSEPDIFFNENFDKDLKNNKENEMAKDTRENINSENFEKKNDEILKDKQLLLDSLKLGMKSDIKYVTKHEHAESVDTNRSIQPSPTRVSNEDVTEYDKLRYSCSQCPYRCNALKSFKCHIAMHETKRKYICDFCNWSAGRLNLLYQHRKVHVKESTFKANPGELIFLNREFVMESEHLPEACNDSYNNASKFINGSIEEKLNQSIPGQRTFICKLCPYSSNNKNYFALHKNLHQCHSRYTCNQCTYSVDKWNLLAQHMKLHKTGIDIELSSSRSKPRYHCQKCPYYSSNCHLLAVHVTMHASGKKYMCNFCDYSIDRFNLLHQHMRVHDQHVQKQYPMVIKSDLKAVKSDNPDLNNPQLDFESQENPENGDSNESVISEFKCQRCPYSTSSTKEFDDHEMQHNVCKKHTCLYCDYSCQDKNQLMMHIQVHFPGTPIDVGLVTQPSKLSGKDSDIHNIVKPTMTKEKSKQVNELDSTMFESEKLSIASTVAEETTKNPPDSKREVDRFKRKIYVCQYCEREFESKIAMLQHEKQHLIGAQY